MSIYLNFYDKNLGVVLFSNFHEKLYDFSNELDALFERIEEANDKINVKK
jgi:hypothetical protein